MVFPNPETLLIFDGDIILYRIGFGCEDVEQWHFVESRVDYFLQRMFKKFGTYNHVIYLTGKNNFREQVAVSHKYKDRPSHKPKWYSAIKDYLIHCHRTEVINGMEADDAIAMSLTRNPNSIHIGIDKDLLQVQGWHYRYGTHNSPEVPLRYIKNEGFLNLNDNGKRKKIEGGGYPFFYAQLLLGDKTDSIYGPPKTGDVKTYNTLKDCVTEEDYYKKVKEAYQEAFGDEAESRLLENANLLYMVRELDDEGKPILWKPPS